MANTAPHTQPVAIATNPDPYLTNDNSNPQQGSARRTPSPPVEAPAGKRNVNEPEAKNDNRSTAAKSPPNKKDNRKLFVGGLPADVTEEEFRDFFGQFGELVDSVVMFDRETHRSRGFGFVTYRDLEVADRLLSMRQEDAPDAQVDPKNTPGEPRIGRLVMRGKTCEVKAAEPKENPKPARRGFSNQGMNGVKSNSVGRNMNYAPSSRQVDFIQGVPGGYAPHHYAAAGHLQYPVFAPGHYPSYYHPGMFGVGGYNPAHSMYAPMGHEVVDHYNFNVHPHMMYPPHPQAYQVPPMAAYTAAQKLPIQQSLSTSLSSVMQPAAPGIPTREETL